MTLKTLQQRIARLPTLKTVANLVGRSGKVVDHFYISAEWKQLRNQIIKDRGWRCQDPACSTPRGPWKQIYGDHMVELSDGGSALDPRNVLLRCGACHGRKTTEAKARRALASARNITAGGGGIKTPLR
jgi:5-methylcytosine-specific restriction protein A